MVDFSQLLRKPASDAKRPPLLPAGDYPGVILKREFRDDNRNRTPFVRFTLRLTDFPQDLTEADREGIDLSKRQLRRDYYLTDDADWRLSEMLDAIGLDIAGRGFDVLIEEALGTAVLVEVQQKPSQQSGELFNDVGKLLAIP